MWTLMKIPGLAHEVDIKVVDGLATIELSLRGDIIAKAPLKAASESGIAKGIVEVAKTAEISHQIPDSIVKDLAKKLSSETGYFDATSMPKPTSQQAEVPQEIEEKLNTILNKLDEITKRLKSMEEKWG